MQKSVASYKRNAGWLYFVWACMWLIIIGILIYIASWQGILDMLHDNTDSFRFTFIEMVAFMFISFALASLLLRHHAFSSNVGKITLGLAAAPVVVAAPSTIAAIYSGIVYGVWPFSIIESAFIAYVIGGWLVYKSSKR